MFNKVLVANRGEIACRVISSLKQLGIKSVAVYSDSDINSKHVDMADEAYGLEGYTSKESYLDIDKIISIAKKSKAQAVHPGYGFLSENYKFAEICLENNIEFIGPKSEAIKIMGQKLESKNLLSKNNIPVIPGYSGDNQDPKFLLDQANKIGYPLLIKASSGGGGKGMRLCHSKDNFIEDLDAAKREAMAGFGSDIVILEKYISAPRHIEVQILFDKHGNGLYLYERDCSIQRRHQKIIEEAPFELFDQSLREKIGKTAVDIGKAVEYQNAGTVEFLLDENNNFYFMEMNTRLQVEHPVTEMITGLDLVKLQLHIAFGNKLKLTQEDIIIKGHAIEARIYAEDTDNNFMPAIGEIDYLNFPDDSSSFNNHKNIRIDSGIKAYDEISMHYDPMLAKVIAFGNTRHEAIYNLEQALRNTNILGVKNNVDFLNNIISNQQFINNKITTNFVDDNLDKLIYKKHDQEFIISLIIASYYEYLIKYKNSKYNLSWMVNNNFRLNHSEPFELCFQYNGEIYNIYLHQNNSEDINVININNELYKIKFIKIIDNKIHIIINEQLYKAISVHHKNSICVFSNSKQYIFEYLDNKYLDKDDNDSEGVILSPMPGTIISVKVTKGNKIDKGSDLVTLEAMKIEHTIKANKTGVIKNIFFKEGDTVSAGDELLAME